MPIPIFARLLTTPWTATTLEKVRSAISGLLDAKFSVALPEKVPALAVLIVSAYADDCVAPDPGVQGEENGFGGGEGDAVFQRIRPCASLKGGFGLGQLRAGVDT